MVQLRACASLTLLMYSGAAQQHQGKNGQGQGFFHEGITTRLQALIVRLHKWVREAPASMRQTGKNMKPCGHRCRSAIKKGWRGPSFFWVRPLQEEAGRLALPCLALPYSE